MATFKESMDIGVIHIGNMSQRKDGSIYSLKNYALFLNELSENIDHTKLFCGVCKEGDSGYDFSNEVKINKSIKSTISRGNTPNTPLALFFLNNYYLLIKLIYFCWPRSNYFIFLPSPIGICGILILVIFRRKQTLGVYIGGNYSVEQKYEQRLGFLKKIIKNITSSIIDPLVNYSIKKSDYVITPSYDYYERFKDRKNIFLTPPLLNIDETDLLNSVQIANALGETDRFITFCGELRHAKGIVDLLNAFILCTKENSFQNCKLKIIGSGQAMSELEDIVNENKLSQRVIFCGQIKDKEQLKKELKNSTVFVLPSYSEGFPRVAYECFTLGIPTILTPIGGIPYLVKDSVHTIFVTPGDVLDISQKIQLLLNNNQLRVAIVENAKNIMREIIFPRLQMEGSLAQMIVRKITNLQLKK